MNLSIPRSQSVVVATGTSSFGDLVQQEFTLEHGPDASVGALCGSVASQIRNSGGLFQVNPEDSDSYLFYPIFAFTRLELKVNRVTLASSIGSA